MQALPLVFLGLGLLFLVYALLLYKKQDKTYYMYLIPSPFLFFFGYMMYVFPKHSIASYYESFDNLQGALDKLGAVLPTIPSTLQCVDGADLSIQSQISGYLAGIKTARDNLVGAYGNITSSTTWSAVPDTDKTNITASYNRVIAATQNILDKSTTLTVNGRTIQSWQGTYTCADRCVANGTTTSGNTSDKASYNVGGTCSCPAGYFPQLDSNNFVRCLVYDTSSVSKLNSDIDTLTNLNSQNFNNATSFNLRCGNNICPSTLPLAIEQPSLDYYGPAATLVASNISLPYSISDATGYIAVKFSAPLNLKQLTVSYTKLTGSIAQITLLQGLPNNSPKSISTNNDNSNGTGNTATFNININGISNVSIQFSGIKSITNIQAQI